MSSQIVGGKLAFDPDQQQEQQQQKRERNPNAPFVGVATVGSATYGTYAVTQGEHAGSQNVALIVNLVDDAGNPVSKFPDRYPIGPQANGSFQPSADGNHLVLKTGVKEEDVKPINAFTDYFHFFAEAKKAGVPMELWTGPLGVKALEGCKVEVARQPKPNKSTRTVQMPDGTEKAFPNENTVIVKFISAPAAGQTKTTGGSTGAVTSGDVVASAKEVLSITASELKEATLPIAVVKNVNAVKEANKLTYDSAAVNRLINGVSAESKKFLAEGATEGLWSFDGKKISAA